MSVCQHCHHEFETTKPSRAKFCSTRCRVASHRQKSAPPASVNLIAGNGEIALTHFNGANEDSQNLRPFRQNDAGHIQGERSALAIVALTDLERDSIHKKALALSLLGRMPDINSEVLEQCFGFAVAVKAAAQQTPFDISSLQVLCSAMLRTQEEMREHLQMLN